MPRQPKTPPPAEPNAIVASAARVLAGRKKNRPQSARSWQTEAWEMLDVVGELEFYREYAANGMSQCTLSVVEDTPDGEVPTDDPTALAAMDALFGGETGQGEMLAAMAGHLAIPGETWLCGLLTPSADPSIDTWRVLSPDEVKDQGGRWVIDRGDGEPETYDQDQVYIARIWQPHPRKWVEATSSVRTALPILRQLVGLSKRDAANIDSRLIGNGILAVPTEATFASPRLPDDDPNDPLTDPLMAAIVEAGLAAIENPGSAEALFPVLVKAPAQYLDKIQHITFASPLDDKAKEQQLHLITRLANSLDVPAEVLLGMGDINHWGQWFTDETSIKMHTQPRLDTIANGLTTRYLWPCLQGSAEALDPALRRFRVVGSTANLQQRPNRTDLANAAHAADLITDAAWARETQFADTDLLSHADNTEERKRRLLTKTAGGVTTADVTVAALDALGVSLTPQASEVDAAGTDAAALPAGTTPAAVEPNRSAPTTEQTAGLLAAAEQMALRAVERGWNKAGRRGRVRTPVPADMLDAALADAWTGVPRVAALLGLDSAQLGTTLDRYARTLLASGADHDPHALAQALVNEVLHPPIALPRGA